MKVVTLALPRLAMTWANWRMVSPSPFFIPNSLGSWLTVTKMARPNTNPSMTGRDKKAVMNPSFSRPAATKIRPVMTMKPEAITMY
jgi:hypothetical protein